MKIELRNQSIAFEDVALMIKDHATEIYVESVSLMGDNDSALALHKKIRGHPSLEKLTFVDVTAPEADTGIDMLVSMLFVSAPKLQSVRFEKTTISPMSVASVAYSTSLQELMLVNNGFTDGDVVALASAIAKCPSLVTVDLRGNQLSDVGRLAASSILEKCPTLGTIRLNDGEGGRTAGVDGANRAIAASDRPTPRAA